MLYYVIDGSGLQGSGREYGSALQAASARDYEQIVQMLLKRGRMSTLREESAVVHSPVASSSTAYVPLRPDKFDTDALTRDFLVSTHPGRAVCAYHTQTVLRQSSGHSSRPRAMQASREAVCFACCFVRPLPSKA